MNPTAINCPLFPQPVTYNGTMNGVLTSYCTSCHASNKQGYAARLGAPPGVNYDTYASAVTWGEEAREFVMGGIMPPPPVHLDPNVACQFDTWARNGFPH